MKFSLLFCAVFWAVFPWHEMHAQNNWMRIAGITAAKSSKMFSESGFSLLYSADDVLYSESSGYMWWSIRGQLPHGLACAANTPRGFVGLAVLKNSDVIAYSTTNGGARFDRTGPDVLFNTGGRQLTDMVYSAGRLYTFSASGSIWYTEGTEQVWTEIVADTAVGQLSDVAWIRNLWVVCGSGGTMYSADGGLSWIQIPIPIQLGSSISLLEVHGNELWAGGLFGAAVLNMQERAWHYKNEGLPNVPSLFPRPIDLRSLGGVLFCVFRTGGVNNTMYRWTGSRWTNVDDGGLPPGEHIRRFCMGLQNGYLQVYSSGTDVNFQGVYAVRAGVATSAEEDASHLNIGPNPASDHVMVTISNTGDEADVSLINVLGQQVFHASTHGSLTIPTSHLPSGTYLLRYGVANKTIVRPLVIAR
ncbi:MAG: T9SS type A sorting domain-containing protein [Flavobacteriales bacterium]|nr:MAG: T9SS type A sorting domain-containing protein [Bacteroidota bacterium]KXK35590.1 MAG: hypothetical protein UZ06_CHB003000323 [Chlorobi bacterium OLB6]MBE2264682.1 T9SS type A sorting domain-containing protein [Flavobacteriales bacterium]MBV6463863.1 hypothetical protein [Chlorobiota bacterium]MBW7854303.1 T9SS type A sorting domain-containing protein [Candidatus Kapabacteria bacterium]MCC6332035.1 T9SS type A sorting domain-containing protein [Ignavibacteria bacterium]